MSNPKISHAKMHTNQSKGNKVPQKDSLLEFMESMTYYEGKEGFYATIKYGNQKKSVYTMSPEFFDYVSACFYELENVVPDKKEIENWLKIIRHKHRTQNKGRALFEKRYANVDDTIYINMANSDFQYIKVTDGAFTIESCEDTPLFVTDIFEKEMPYPVEADFTVLNSLKQFVNLNDDDLFLFVIWLVASMNPKIATPILYLQGEAGSGKSSIQNVIRDLIDPNMSGLINWDGTSLHDITIALSRSYAINFDNISKVTDKESDYLCQTVTGGTKPFRVLYTNSELATFDLRTRACISSVKNCVFKQDLAQRILFLNPPTLKYKDRIGEDIYKEQYEKKLPEIFGVLLEILALAMQFYPAWRKNRSAQSRLSSFELFGKLIATLLEPDTGLDHFDKLMRKNQIEQIFLNDKRRPFFEGMLEMVDEADGFNGKLKELYECTENWILDVSETDYPDNCILDYDVFAKAIHHFSDGITALGYDIEFYMSKSDNYSSIRITSSRRNFS